VLALRLGSRAQPRASIRVALSALTLTLVSGFDWPGRAARNVSALTAAETQRERRDALRLLRELEQPFDLAAAEPALLHGDPGVRADAVALLGRRELGPRVLARALEDPAPEVRVAALRAIGQQPDAHLQELLRSLGDREPSVRSASIDALAWSEDRSAIAALTSSLHDPVLEVRARAVAALAGRREPAVLSALLRTFHDALPELRVSLLDALAPHASGRAEHLFDLALGDPDEQVVLAALRGFARAGGGPAERIAPLASAPSPAVASAAARLLARSQEAGRTHAARERWLAPLERTAERSLSAAASVALLDELERTVPAGEALATDPLLDWLARAPAALRPRIASLAERAGGPVPANFVLPLLEGAEPSLKAPLLSLLARTEGAARLAPLQRALGDPDPRVHRPAMLALARTLDAHAAPELIARFADAPAAQRKRLVRVMADGLARLPQVDPALSERICDLFGGDLEADPEHASLVVRALGALGHACGRALVRTAMSDVRSGVSIAALRASVRDRSDLARGLRRRARLSNDVAIAATAVVAEALAGDPAGPSTLQDLSRAAWPLGPAHAFALASRRPSEALCPLLESREPATRTNALAGLAADPAQRCADQRATVWLAQSSVWPMRLAAAKWAAARARLGPPSVARALGACSQFERDPRVRDACLGRASSASEPAAARHTSLPRATSRFDARALVLEDGRVLISLPDGAGEVGWPAVRAILTVPAWLSAYVKE
jgi:HEAT repeat protein